MRVFFLILIAVSIALPRVGNAQVCLMSKAWITANGLNMTKQSGLPALDQNINIELGELWKAFSVSPSFFLYDDQTSANAFAMPNSITPGSMGTVAFGVKMMRDEYEKSGSKPNYTIAIILAHEFAHIVQFRNGVNLSGPQRELQADYMAGWYAGNRERNTHT